MSPYTTRAINRAAERISDALDDMVSDLPSDAAPQMAIEIVVRRLAHSQPWFLQLIMEDDNIREAYWAATAERPPCKPIRREER